jgi:hypothetical protein
VSALTDRFEATLAADLADYFRAADLAEITEIIRDEPDSDLRQLIELDSFREGAVDTSSTGSRSSPTRPAGGDRLRGPLRPGAVEEAHRWPHRTVCARRGHPGTRSDPE